MAVGFLRDSEVAALLGITVPGLRNKVLRGDPLPPHCRLPGMRVRLWPEQLVREWIDRHVVGESREAVRPRGRPRKAAGGAR